MGRRWFALESAAVRVCREAGGRVTNVMVRDLDLPVPDAADGRRQEVVVDGLPLFGGSQLAVDTTLVCALRSDGTPHRGAAEADGRRRAVEVGGRWSAEMRTFVAQLAKAKFREEPHLLQKSAEQAWRMRWGPSSLVPQRRQ